MPLWLLANPVTSLLGGVSLLLLVGVGVQTYRLTLAETANATAKQHQAEAEATASRINTLVAQAEAKNARSAADQEAKNHAELEQIQSHAVTLQATLNQKQRDFDIANGKLQEIITHASPMDRRELGPAVLAIVDGLRRQQQARDAGNSSASASNH